jgi:hypothetical protein
MRVEFVKRESGPERLACEAELLFDEGQGALAGMKLVGLSIWKSPDGDLYVTFPSRAFGAGQERRYFDFLRSQDGNIAAARTLKEWVVEQYRRQKREAGRGEGI